MISKDRIAQVKESAEGLLGKKWEGSISLSTPEVLEGNESIQRFTILSGPLDAPKTIVAKVFDYPSSNDQNRAFVNELTGWHFLHEVCTEPSPLPQYYGGSIEEEFIIIEDLTEGEKVSVLLQGEDSSLATKALLEYWKSLGRIHANTIGKRVIYEEVRRSLGFNKTEPFIDSSIGQLDHRFKIICDRLDISPPSTSEVELGAIIETLVNPGPFEGYTHGDPCPDNALFINDSSKIIDIEQGAFRHVLLDGTYIHTYWPSCWCTSRLPDSVVYEVETAYRNELIKKCPAAENDELFYRSVANISVMHAINSWWPWTGTDLFDKDEQWGIVTMRQRIIARLSNAVFRTEKLGDLEGIGSTLKAILDKLHTMWLPEVHSIPYFKAYKDD